MDTPVDIATGRKRKRSPAPPSGGPPDEPSDREVFELHRENALAHPQLQKLLHKKNLTHKGLEKYMKDLLAATAQICGPQFVQSLVAGVATGDRHAMRLFAESTALIKVPGGINISMQQNNTSIEQKQARVSFESIARELTMQDASVKVIEATPVREAGGK